MQYNYTNRWYLDSTDRRASWFYIIELSGVQFGLKSYSMHGFQNWTSSTVSTTLIEFWNHKILEWFQNKIAQDKVQLPLYYIILNHKIQAFKTTLFLVSADL